MTTTWSTTLWLDDVDEIPVKEIGLAEMLPQYRGDQPRLQGALEALLDQIEGAQTVTLQVLANRWPLTAVGDQLDTIGRIVMQPRGELTDDQYRLFILARILVNRASGTIEELIEILERVGVSDMKISEFYPAELRISIADFDYGELIGELISEAKGGGIIFRWVWNEEEDDDVFQFAATLGADDADTDSGFGDLTEATQTTGGYWSGGLVY